MTKKVDAKITSVALQHRSGSGVTKYSKLNPAQLHQQTLNARGAFFKMCVGAETYAVDVLLPYLRGDHRTLQDAGGGGKGPPEWQAHG
jgi:hypothetical protein